MAPIELSRVGSSRTWAPASTISTFIFFQLRCCTCGASAGTSAISVEIGK